ncbi:MAG: PAAR-like protein [Rhodopila sp.]
MANPGVAAVTAAAMGVPTPMPCVPLTVTPWIPGAPTVMLGNFPALGDDWKCLCTWACRLHG